MILINAFGIQDSGGITVLNKLLLECINNGYSFLVVCNKNYNINTIISRYNVYPNFKFLVVENKNFLYRLYYENIVFRKIIKEYKIDLVYNFSGTAQFFLPIPQIVKVHNLLFYSKKINKVYFEKKEYFKWIKQIFLKRLVFHSMIKQTQYIEVQSNHVKEYISDFIDISKKQFFIKSDIEASKNLFETPKQYDFSKKIRFLYIVGPHFEYLHKNFEDFVKAMIEFKKEGFDFEVIVTLTKEQLVDSTLWDKNLDEKTKFLGYISKEELKKQFQNNTILVSTSVIETLGLHVIEGIQNGVLTISPDELYAKEVYGEDIITYKLFDSQSLVSRVKKLTSYDNNQIEDIILKNQNYLISNEKQKYNSIVKIFDEILKEKNV